MLLSKNGSISTLEKFKGTLGAKRYVYGPFPADTTVISDEINHNKTYPTLRNLETKSQRTEEFLK